MVIYENIIKGIGESVGSFGDEMFILFGENAPDTLKEYCYLIDVKDASGKIEKGQTLIIDGTRYEILKVGEVAQKNLTSLGHLTVDFSGNDDVLPGTIMVEKKPSPTMEIGTRIKIEG